MLRVVSTSDLCLGGLECGFASLRAEAGFRGVNGRDIGYADETENMAQRGPPLAITALSGPNPVPGCQLGSRLFSQAVSKHGLLRC